MKEGFIKKNWISLAMVLIFIGASIVIRDAVIIAATIIFTLAFLNIYRKYDAEEQKYDDWWAILNKCEKEKFFNRAHILVEEKEGENR